MGIANFAFDWAFKMAEVVREEMEEHRNEKYKELRDIVYYGIDEAAGKGLVAFNVRLNGFEKGLREDMTVALDNAGYSCVQQDDFSYRISWEEKAKPEPKPDGDETEPGGDETETIQ